MSSRNTLGYNPTLCILPFMYHLSPRIRLLIIIRQSYRIKLTNTLISLQNHARILPSNRGPSFHLGPRYLGLLTSTQSSLGRKIINPTFPILITRVSILHRRILNLRPLSAVQLNHSFIHSIISFLIFLFFLLILLIPHNVAPPSFPHC